MTNNSPMSSNRVACPSVSAGMTSVRAGFMAALTLGHATRRAVESFAIRHLPLAILLVLAPPVLAQWHVQHSPHDLSRSGPGPVKAVTEGEVCIFCHTPHNGAPDTPLWNRFDQPRHYRIYDSSTTDARIDQPRGASKLCLSCHDGVLAVGLVRSREQTDPIFTTFPHLTREHGGLGTDLGDDHPISFRYDRALAAADGQLRNPDTLTERLPLGPHNTVECTTCHDPHNNRLGNFLNVPDRMSAICLSCHDLHGWKVSSHAISPAPVIGRIVDPTETLPYGTVRDNACTNCHKVHSAPGRERLLRFVHEEQGCLNCHSGNVGAFNIAREIEKRSNHSGRRRTGAHDPAEDALVTRAHSECVDCHNPHSVRGNIATARIRAGATTLLPIQPEMSNVTGVTAQGGRTDKARFEYEVCLKCHGDSAPVITTLRETVTRQVGDLNVRSDFRTSNESFHPVFDHGRGRDVPSLVPPYTTSSIITCTDCHNSDDARINGGSGPNGPHGSIFEPLLARNYDTRDFAVESAQTYALCYGCHSRSSILNNESFPLHNLHVVNENAPCSACHDAHGVPNSARGGDHSHLINFDISIVRPSDVSRRLEFRDTGRLSGSCTLTCHGFNHEGLTYQR